MLFVDATRFSIVMCEEDCSLLFGKQKFHFSVGLFYCASQSRVQRVCESYVERPTSVGRRSHKKQTFIHSLLHTFISMIAI